MSREIKFRAWILSLKKMSRVWTMGFDEFGEGSVDQVMTSLISPANPQRKIADVILMQYTSLKDRKGVEIYEGDIISLPVAYQSDIVGQVVWGDSGWFLDIGSRFESLFSKLIDRSEVVGNIYTHPSLLTAPEDAPDA